MKKIIFCILGVALALLTTACHPFEMPNNLFKSVVSNNTKAVENINLNSSLVNSTNQRKQTPLMIAAYNGNVKIAQLLINAGAKINAKDINGGTPLMYAAITGQSHVLKYLLNHGAEVNTINSKGQTALMLAGQSGQKHCIQILLKHFANFSLKDKYKYNAYDYARRFSQSDTAAYLAEYAKKNNINLNLRGWYVKHN